jgi:hypothetical protein
MKQRIITILIGVIFCSVGLFYLSGKMVLVSTGIKTEGEVVQIGQVTDSEGDYMYYPVVNFADKAGKKHTIAISDTKSNYVEYSVGDSINLVYLEGDVNSVAINSIFWIYIFPNIFVVIGFFILAMGFYTKD